jgi:chromosome segregation protein
MHLKSLELMGFKSFVEAKIDLPRGVTAIVGPNGAGKSNVVDAILWVLGEQSTKTLRSEKMEDVIFNGTQMRKPMGMAEVSLIIAGIQGGAGESGAPLPYQLHEYQEIMLTRRLYRNGDSEYLINKTAARLKDIRALLLDTRAGTKGHSIIEQGRLTQILNASPQERRDLIEETAGIIRYKKQKTEALHKLDSTQQNLLRVRDIVGEVKRQLNALDRQSKQAKIYQTLMQQARELEVRILATECNALLETHSGYERDCTQLSDQEIEQASLQARVQEDVERGRLDLLGSEQAMDRIREELAEADRRQAQAMRTIEVERSRVELFEQQHEQARTEAVRLNEEEATVTSLLEERYQAVTGYESRLEEQAEVFHGLEASAQSVTSRLAEMKQQEQQMRSQVVGLTVQLTSGENAISALTARQAETLRRSERLSAERADLERQRGLLATDVERVAAAHAEHAMALETYQTRRDTETLTLQQCEQEVAELTATIGQQQEQLAASQSQHEVLDGLLREAMGYGRRGEESSTSVRAACHGVREAVAEWITVPAGLDRAVEAMLGERLRAWLVNQPIDGLPALEFLRHHRLGKGTFLPLQPRYAFGAHEGGVPSWWSAIKGETGVVGLASELLTAPGEFQETLRWLVDRMVVVDTLDTAFRLWAHGVWATPDGPILVTQTGEVLESSGALVGGSGDATSGLLERRRATEELERTIQSLSKALEQNRRRREDAEVAREQTRSRLKELVQAIRDAEMQILALGKDQSGYRTRLDELTRRVEFMSVELQDLDVSQRGLEGEVTASRERLAIVDMERSAQEESLQALTASLQALEVDARQFQDRITEMRLAIAALNAQRSHAGEEIQRLEREQRERAAKVLTLQQQVATIGESIARSQEERLQNEVVAQEFAQRVTAVRAQLIQEQEAHSTHAACGRRLEQSMDEVRQAISALREARSAVEVKKAEVHAQLQMREDTLSGTYQLTVEAAWALLSANQEGSSSPSEALAQEEASVPTGGLEVWRGELEQVRRRLERIGPVNLAAIEECQQLQERYQFLTTQEADLSQSIASLREIIQRIHLTTKELFYQTFTELQEKFGEVFGRLFPGGRAELVLVEPTAVEGEQAQEGREPGVDIVAQPPGKRLKSITMLSGGEKTLTAMALLFASFLIRPTPFCVLDEIDAPLDEENVMRFTKVLRELSSEAQFIVITHNKRTMSIADSLFGVTMEEPGVSKTISVRLQELQPA